MDPLSIIAITISIGQAVDRITTLTAKAKRYRDAPEDISTLIAEIADLKLVLDKLQSTTANFPVQDLPTLKRLLDSCGANVLQIETLIREAFVKPGSPEDTSKPKVHRFAWVQKKHEIERLREQLRDSRALLGLQLIGINANASPADIIAPYGITALSLAINYGRMEVCKLLIETGGHQYAPNSQGRVADARTFWRFNVDECALHPSRLIMDRISSLGSADRHLEAVSHSILGPLQEDMPFSRLHKLVLGITTESLENVLRESRAYINDADLLGRAALHWAACQGDSSLVKKLLCCGADPDIRDRDGKTPLHMAAGLGHSEAAASLIAAGANVEVQDLFGATPMHHAAMQGQTAIIDMLLDVGADVNSLNAFSENPLMMAALANEAQSADLLCRQGANIEHRCDWRFTPLLKALKVSAYDVLQILIRREARTDVITSSGKTLIHLAAAYADAETLQLLASTNISTVDVEARDEKRCTALDYLKMRSDTDVVLQDFRKLMWCAAREGASEEDSLSDLTNDEELESEEFFDAVTFLTEGPGQENP
ncbi:hypothetical protein GJ744_006675 [Endocarpon pusillum]|uniref:Azaphilone pigments biosynthesis cluster protein L N-terminal domain-containing protein n=1 Tax=Endocarpon pusillum TaxID=364733 RepID=A0A8H7ANV9_9EURO|nr:hypothetical protein GJ744_006675 [Endocarpon pusillum]